MFPIALLALAAVFGLLLLGRIGGANRGVLIPRWPALLFAGAAIFALTRGAIGPALGLACVAVLAWVLGPKLTARPTPRAPANDPANAEARRLLGVGPTATESEIRSAYRAKMALAHPDRGGGHAEAARLTAARDRLLRKR